jgi:hypothetical protein
MCYLSLNSQVELELQSSGKFCSGNTTIEFVQGMNSNDPWSRAIHESTACLWAQKQSRSGDSDWSFLQALDTALAYLGTLENHLVVANNSSNGHEEGWSHPPSGHPPSWTRFSQVFVVDKDMATQEALSFGSHLSRTYDDDDAGDVPMPFGIGENMDCRRLLIRILTCQSEIFASKASLFASRDRKDFREGAAQLYLALARIHQALQVADSQICKWWAHMESMQPTDVVRTREKDALVEDANIVEVAIHNMTQRREKLLGLCHQEQNWLLRKLEPQWESRDEVKQRIGLDRWTNNPNPKGTYAEQRREYEDRLRVVREAMEALQALDAATALERANKIQRQLRQGVRPGEDNYAGDATDPGLDVQTIENQRYNGLRPTSEWQSRRVDPQLYPDPTSFGWTFTGSWQTVEFFERTVEQDSIEYLVKLDWYFTTGTIKTSLDHPTQGKTQLFGKQVSPQDYKKILKNPRVHTGNRYQRRRNGGRGRGGRNGTSNGGRQGPRQSTNTP